MQTKATCNQAWLFSGHILVKPQLSQISSLVGLHHGYSFHRFIHLAITISQLRGPLLGEAIADKFDLETPPSVRRTTTIKLTERSTLSLRIGLRHPITSIGPTVARTGRSKIFNIKINIIHLKNSRAAFAFQPLNHLPFRHPNFICTGRWHDQTWHRHGAGEEGWKDKAFQDHEPLKMSF